MVVLFAAVVLVGIQPSITTCRSFVHLPSGLDLKLLLYDDKQKYARDTASCRVRIPKSWPRLEDVAGLDMYNDPDKGSMTMSGDHVICELEGLEKVDPDMTLRSSTNPEKEIFQGWPGSHTQSRFSRMGTCALPPSGPRTVDLLCGVGYGSWKRVEEYRAVNGPFPKNFDIDVTYLETMVNPHDVLIKLKEPAKYANEDLRFVVRTKSGAILMLCGSWDGNFNYETVTGAVVTPNDIASVVMLERPYTWVRFRNVHIGERRVSVSG